MNIRLIAFTRRGAALGEALTDKLIGQGEDAALTLGFGEGHPPLADWSAEAMRASDGIVFIGATGIAVRAVAPHLRGKREDPAVVVVDENARFAISLLSGHVGGANALAERVAALCGAQAVVTTATDGRGLFAVDVWAKAQGFTLPDAEAAKAVSATLLDGRAVGLVSEFPLETPLPQGLSLANGGPIGLYVGVDSRNRPFQTTLWCVPRALTLGIGCRRGVPEEAIAGEVERALHALGACAACVRAVHSIDRKADEAGLLALCRRHGWPFHTFSAEALAAVPGAFASSERVRRAVGVDNVCERAAMIHGGSLALPKQAANGVTVAIAKATLGIRFE